MARRLCPIAADFVEAYYSNIKAGLNEADAWTAARLVVPPDLWTRSFKTVVSRYLKKAGLKTQDRRGGNKRDALTQAVFNRVREAQQEMKKARALMQEELDIAMEHAAGIIKGEAPWLTLDVLADTERNLGRASTWRRHEVDRITAPAIAASLHVQQVRRYWLDGVETIRADAMAEIHVILAKSPGPQAERLRTRAEYLLGIREVSVPVVTAWAADPPSVPGKTFRVVALDSSDELEDAIEEDFLGDELHASVAVRASHCSGRRWASERVAALS